MKGSDNISYRVGGRVLEGSYTFGSFEPGSSVPDGIRRFPKLLKGSSWVLGALGGIGWCGGLSALGALERLYGSGGCDRIWKVPDPFGKFPESFPLVQAVLEIKFLRVLEGFGASESFWTVMVDQLQTTRSQNSGCGCH